jgi:putative peptidoglycan lipid II flippase
VANEPSRLIGSTSAEIAWLAADSRTVAVWTLLSRMTGFGRVIAIGAVLGPTYFGNLFQTLAVLPSLVVDSLAGSLITALLVPPLSHSLQRQELAGARRLAGRFLGITLLVCLGVVALTVLAGPLVLALITGAVRDPAVREWQLRIGWPLLAMLMPQVFFYGIIAVATAAQNARRRFGLAAAAPALENAGVIAIMLVSAAIFGVGVELDAMTSAQLLFLGLGSTATVGLHAAVQWWGAYRAGIPLLLRVGWRDTELRSILRRAVPSGACTGLGGLVHVGLLVVAGSIPGGAVAFRIGWNFFSLPVALCARPVAAAQLPLLSRSFDRGDIAAFAQLYRAGLTFTVFLGLPASLLFFSIPEAFANAVSFGGMARPDGVVLVAAAIGSLGLGIIGEVLFTVSMSASYARRDAIMPLQAMAVRAAITFAGMGVALGVVDGPLVVWMLGLSASAANLVGAAILHGKLKRALSPLDGAGFRGLFGHFAVSCAAVGLSILVADQLSDPMQSGCQRIGVAVAASLAAAGLYLILQRLRGSEELRQLLSGNVPGRTLPPGGPEGELGSVGGTRAGKTFE